MRRAWSPALLRPLESGQWRFPSGSFCSFCPPPPSGRGVELFCCRLFGRIVLSSGEGVAGLLLAFWCRIWKRRRFSQMRSSTKFSSLVGERLKWRFLIFDEVFLAGRKTVFLLLLRCLCQRTTDGWFVVFVGVECVGVWVFCCIVLVLISG